MPDTIGNILDVAPLMTKLSPAEELRYEIWKSMLPKNLQYDGDYDLRGAFKDGLKAQDNGHFDDTYKLPNHPTFSTGSRYSTPENPGGSWTGDDKSGWTFNASPANLKYRTAQDLQGYWDQVEAPNGNRLVLPQ